MDLRGIRKHAGQRFVLVNSRGKIAGFLRTLGGLGVTSGDIGGGLSPDQSYRYHSEAEQLSHVF
jgi:hypothetical protein